MTMRFKTQELLDILQCLAGDFPQTFVFAQHEPHRPLKIRIDHDLAQRYPALTRAERDAVLRFYTSRVGYLVACTEGVPRYDLDGHVAGHVAADEAAHAATRLAGIMASRVAKRAAAMAAKRAEREAARNKAAAAAPPPPPPPSSIAKRPLLSLPGFKREVAR
jgi:sRNA-binding protein